MFIPADSGHGGQVRDKDGDEVDGWDEGLYHNTFPNSCLPQELPVIFPLDHEKNGYIVDDVRTC